MTPTPEATAQPAHATGPIFDQPVQAIFDNYIKAQAALVQDSLAGVTDAGSSMTKALSGAATNTLPPAVTSQAESLAKAKDLESARAAFKLLSNSLIEFAKSHNATGTYHIAYCSMAKASWLQTGTTVMNPYFGKAMPHCGQFKS
jgi:Cu(I)/Ag(I) efflux system membrane fusion protein